MRLTVDNRSLVDMVEVHMDETAALRNRVRQLEAENRMLCELLLECGEVLQEFGISFTDQFGIEA